MDMEKRRTCGLNLPLILLEKKQCLIGRPLCCEAAAVCELALLLSVHELSLTAVETLLWAGRVGFCLNTSAHISSALPDSADYSKLTVICKTKNN